MLSYWSVTRNHLPCGLTPVEQISLDGMPMVYVVADADLAQVSYPYALLSVFAESYSLGSIVESLEVHQANRALWSPRALRP